MTGWFYFWFAVCLFAAFGIGFWCGVCMMHKALVYGLSRSVQARGFFEIKGVRFIAVVTNPAKTGDSDGDKSGL